MLQEYSQLYQDFGQWWISYLPEGLFVVVIGWLNYLIFWWGTNLIMYIIYHFNLLSSWKIQAADKWPERSMVMDAIKKNLIAHCLLQPPVNYALYWLHWQGKVFDEFPSPFIFFRDLLILWACADGSFYWLHRLAHRPAFYWIHKEHHKWKTTIGIASTHAHPLEEIFVNGVSTLCGLLFVTPHFLTFSVYMAMRLEETVEEHSGYDLKCSPWYLLRTNRHHDFHHSQNVGAYGTFPFWDKICGTDFAYDSFCAKQKSGKKSD